MQITEYSGFPFYLWLSLAAVIPFDRLRDLGQTETLRGTVAQSITVEEMEFLASEEAQSILHEFADSDPAKFVLRNKHLVHAALLATQLSLRKKAASKIPAWLAAGCIFTRQALEQCTSEAVAAVKPFGSGPLVIDLSCGLGVDAAQMSKSYEKVIAVEPDAGLCALAKFNFKKLGIGNIEVMNSSADDFLKSTSSPLPPSTFFYLDPSRRDEGGKRKYHPADTSPDYFSIEKKIMVPGTRVMLKTSPMFDYREGLRILNHAKSVTVISEDNECKEILYEMENGFAGEPLIRAIAVIHGRKYEFERYGILNDSDENEEIEENIFPGCYLYEPDVSFYMTGLQEEMMQILFPGLKAHQFSPGGYFFSNEKETPFAGRVYHLIEMIPFKPAVIRDKLKALGILQINIGKKNFPLPVAQIRQDLRIKEGGRHHLLFSVDGNDNKVALVCEKVY